jgi:integrase
MPTLSITELAVRALKSEVQTDFWDTNLRGFGIRIGPRSKTWVLKHKNKRYTLGRWPKIGVKQARDEAHRRLGAYEALPAAITFTDALTIYRTTHMPNMRPKTRIEQDRILSKYWTPLYTKPLSQITRSDIAEILDDLSEKPVMALNARSALRTFINWAHQRNYCPQFPRFKKTKSKSRDRILSDDEIRKIWKACGTPTAYNAIIKLALLTGQRRGELAAIQQDWITDNTLTFPPHITKNNTQHTIYFSDTCISLTKNLSPNYNAWSKPLQRLHNRSGTTQWSVHDARRTVATNMARIGISLPVVEKLLNHRSGTFSGIVGIYQRHQYSDEVRAALIKYETWLLNMVSC